MVVFNQASPIWVVIFIVLLFAKLDTTFYALIYCSALTRLAFLYVGEDNIIIPHVVFLILFIKYIYTCRKYKIRLTSDKWLMVFMIWCFISIPFACLHPNLVVSGVDKTQTVRLNFHQFTQYAYLLIGYLVYLMTKTLLEARKISFATIVRSFEGIYVITLVFALLQMVLPVDFVNAYFRNAINITGYNVQNARISSFFSEPSVLSVFCAPLASGYMYKLFTEYKLKYFIYLLLFGVVTVLNASSTGILGIAVVIVLIPVLSIYAGKKFSAAKVACFLLAFAAIAIVCISNIEFVSYAVDMLIEKLKGKGVSGSDRLESAMYHIKLALHQILPTGFGTVRAGDLFSSWLCSIGFLGIFLYIYPVAKMCVKLIKRRSQDSIALALNILIHNFLLFISVPEISVLSIWFYYGMAPYVIHLDEMEIPSE